MHVKKRAFFFDFYFDKRPWQRSGAILANPICLIKSIMKKIKIVFITAFLLFTSELIMLREAKAQVSVSFQFFYDNLSPYGNWVSYPGYGYAWAPAIHAGFRPYLTNGRWVFTDLGWTWVSYYDWGWAPFH